MRQTYTALAILLPILALLSISILTISALQTQPKGDPQPPNPHAHPIGILGDPMPPEPHALPFGTDSAPPDPT